MARIAGVCHSHPGLAGAVLSGALSMRRTEKLAVAVTRERAPFLAGSLDALLELNATTTDETAAFEEVLRCWTARVDEHLAPRRDHPHRLVASQRLFGGGEIHADLARFSLTGHDDACTTTPEDEQAWCEDTFDGTHPTDDLDEALDLADQAEQVDGEGPADHLDLVRRTIRRGELHRRRRLRRRVRPRSGVVTNVHIDLRTLSGLRGIDDLADVVLRGEGWAVTKEAAERFTRRQRRALAARDGHCVFPSCTGPPRFCDAHHLHHREHGGPTRTDNAALLCRFDHHLVHDHGWTLTIEDDRWTATDRHGTTWPGRPTPVRPAGPAKGHRSTADRSAR